MSRYISINTKKNVLVKQNYKCATIKNYDCLLWKVNDGLFDEAGFEFDHIDEFSRTKNNNEDNIQALCPNCHTVKTKRFQNCKNLLTTSQINMGGGLMEIDGVKKRKRPLQEFEDYLLFKNKKNDNDMDLE